MKKEDVMILILFLLGTLLLLYILIRGQHSPEYVTYKDFYEFAFQIVAISTSLVGVAFAGMGAIWYEIGKIEQKIESSTTPIV